MHKLKEMLMNELYEYEDKAKRMSGGKLSTTELEKIHKLTDTVKNIDKIEALEGGGYSRDGAKEHLINKMEEMMEMAGSSKERKAIEKCIDELED